jgi:nucleotide-binding universal stress UspA family protein
MNGCSKACGRQAQERNVTVETHVLVGQPANRIPKTAATAGADLIGAGHRGRSAFREWVTSRRVVSHAHCPVLVVRAR